MLSREENDLVTRTGPGTPAGDLLRRYWQPAALTDELPSDRPVKAVRLLGEDLVLFRDEHGRYGLLGRQCSHRATDLSFGRPEDGGLRCLYHGWLYDVRGRCLEQPAEPEGSRFHEKIRHKAYPCRELNGIIFAYLGPGDPPDFPDLDCFLAPEEFTFAFKGSLDCNWLQGLEGGIDPCHVSFLHRVFDDEALADRYGLQFRDLVSGSEVPLTKIVREHVRPRIEVEETQYGIRIFALRQLDAANMHIRVTNLLFPNAVSISLGNDMVITQWHVPVDDERSYWYDIFHGFRNPLDRETMRKNRLELYTLPDYTPRVNRSNNYGFNPREQRELTFTGMGMDVNVHDMWAQESPGPVHDRTKEHLGYTDKVIIAYRSMLLQAIHDVRQGGEPPSVARGSAARRLRGPVAVDTLGPVDGWEAYWKEHDLARRAQSKWATNPW